jgi:uncharacterized protein (DUF2141 family)
MTRTRTHRLTTTVTFALLGALAAAAWAEGEPTPPAAPSAPAAAPAAPRGVLRVEVAGLESAKGKVRCALFAQAKGWPTEDAAARARTAVSIRKADSGWAATCMFEGVPAGDYGVSFFHDEDDDGAFDTNLFGIPSEGYGFSKNARATLSAPPFEAARFSFDGGAQTLRLDVQS